VGKQLKEGFISYQQAEKLISNSWPDVTFKGQKITDDVFGENYENYDPNLIIVYNYENECYEVDDIDAYNYYIKKENQYLPVFSK
jgi:hypothetical protein